MRGLPPAAEFDGSSGIYREGQQAISLLYAGRVKDAQTDVANAANAGYENVPGDTHRRKNVREHGYGMTERKSLDRVQ
jgi:hypothetical protein